MIEGISNETRTITGHIMEMIRNGRIRNHKLSQIPSACDTDRELHELQNYRAFLISRNGYNTLQLTGHDNNA